MKAFNEQNPDAEEVFYQSYAFVMSRPSSDINLSTANFVIRKIEGENDGMVSLSSASWGDNVHVIRSPSKRGISHLDEIDFRRAPFPGRKGDPGFDICDIYVSILSDLKAMGF